MMDAKTQNGFLKVLQIAEETDYFKRPELENHKVCTHGNWVSQCKICSTAN